MKLFPVIIYCFSFFHFSFHPGNLSRSGDCDNIPDLNKQVIDFVKSKLSKKVGRGECWDLAAEALNHTGASWDKKFGFGRELKPGKECIYPGDIMQFEDVEIKYKKGNASYFETMEHHTAVIYEVKQKDVFTIADQNNGTSGKKVGLSTLDLKNITKGSFKIYRPIK